LFRDSLQKVQRLTDLYEYYTPYVDEYLNQTMASIKKVNDATYTELLNELIVQTNSAVDAYKDSMDTFMSLNFDEETGAVNRRKYSLAALEALEARTEMREALCHLKRNMEKMRSYDDDYVDGAERWYAALGSAMYAISMTYQSEL